MNIHSAPQLTPAEAALVDAFGERLSLLPGDGAVMVKRDNAIEQIKAGLPTKRIEVLALYGSAPLADIGAGP